MRLAIFVTFYWLFVTLLIHVKLVAVDEKNIQTAIKTYKKNLANGKMITIINYLITAREGFTAKIPD